MLVETHAEQRKIPGTLGWGLSVKLTSSPSKISIVSKPWKVGGQGQKVDQSATEQEYMSIS